MRTRMVALAAVAAVAALAVAGGAWLVSHRAGPTSAPAEPLGAFFTRLVRYQLDGFYGRAWDILHPGHQVLVSRARFVECRNQGLAAFDGIRLARLRVVRLADEPVWLTGIPQRSWKVATVRITLEQAGEQSSFTSVFHALRVDGGWAWILPVQDRTAFRTGECPPP